MSNLEATMRARMLQTFLAEARDLVRELDDGLRRLRKGDHGSDLIAGLFRAAHSIKGSGGMFGLAPLVGFTHLVENLLDRIRGGTLAPSDALVADLQAACDHVADLIEVLVADGGALTDALAARDAALRAVLATYEHARPTDACAQEHDAATDGSSGAETDGNARACDCWQVSVQFGRDVHRFGINPLSFIRDLEALGELTRLETVADGMPGLDAIDPEACYLRLEAELRTDADERRIAEVFDFVQDCSEIRVVRLHGRADEPAAPGHACPAPDARSAEVAVQDDVAAHMQADAPARDRPDAGADGFPAPERQARPRAAAQAAGADAAFIRIRADELDALINRVGELVIAGAGAQLLADCSEQTALREAQAQVSGLVEDIRERALRLRMVPIGETFARFHRVVRDIERDLGKGIDLVIEGGDTELDKSVVDRLADPLLHLVRNAADHSLESPQDRQAAGKPARGCIRLTAAHQGGQVVIEIVDDGRGLDRERILAKALERGLVQAGAVLTDGEVFALIFEPGFSTAAEVTSLSGRGVGMDVVRRNIAELRGRVELDSRPGAGTTVRIRLPLTLAIIDGFLVGVGDASFVLPLERVVECVELPDGLRDGQGWLDLRGHPLPLIRLREQLAVGGAARGRRPSVVVVDCDGQRAGFVVDALLGEFQTVIKPLGPLFSRLEGISGSTILGSGEVALILDAPRLVDVARMRGSASASAALPEVAA